MVRPSARPMAIEPVERGSKGRLNPGVGVWTSDRDGRRGWNSGPRDGLRGKRTGFQIPWQEVGTVGMKQVVGALIFRRTDFS